MVTKEELEKALTHALEEKFIGEKLDYGTNQYKVTDFAIEWLKETYKEEFKDIIITTKFKYGNSQSLSLGIYLESTKATNREMPYFMGIDYSKKRGKWNTSYYGSYYEWEFSGFKCIMCGNETTLEDAVANCKALFAEKKSHVALINEKADKIVAYIKQEFGILGWTEAREILDAVKIRGGW